MGRKIAELFEAFVKELLEHPGPALKKLFLGLGELLDVLFVRLPAFLGEVGGWFREVGEAFLLRLLIREGAPELQDQAQQLGEQIYVASKDWYLGFVVVAIGVVVIFVWLAGYLVTSLVTHRRPSLFISYHHSRQILSSEMEDESRGRQFKPLRIEYREGAVHQEIVTDCVVKLRACDLLMSIPGVAQSFVEAEVLSASSLEKPVVFLVSEDGGSLPNTASKTYPVFSLERARDDSFASLLEFCSYITKQYQSTWQIYCRSLRLPWISWQIRAIALMPLIVLAVLCGLSVYSHGQLASHGYAELVRSGHAQPIIVGHAVILATLLAISTISISYLGAVSIGQWKQVKARQLAREITTRGEFNRDKWIGLMPGLEAGSAMYRCLFETSVSAHHEAATERSTAVTG